MKYSFPILDTSEIFFCLHELQIPFSEEILVRPTYNSVKPIYEGFICLFYDVTKEDINQPNFNAFGILSFPEIFDEAIPIITFVRMLTKIMPASGVYDFSLKDVFKPDSIRTRRNISAIINLGKYREEKVTLFSGLSERIGADILQRDSLEEKNRRMRHELEKIHKAGMAEAPMAAVLNSEIESCIIQLRTLQGEVEQLNEEGKIMRVTYNDLTNRATALRLDAIRRRQDMQNLRDQIVSSPEKIHKALRVLEINIDSDRIITKSLNKRNRDLTARIEIASKIEKELDRVRDLIEEVAEILDKKKALYNGVQHVFNKVESCEASLIQLTVEQRNLRKNKNIITESLDKLSQQADLKREIALGIIERQVTARAENKARHQLILVKTKENEQKMLFLLNQIHALERHHSHRINLVEEKYYNLRSKVTHYHKFLIKMIHLV